MDTFEFVLENYDNKMMKHVLKSVSIGSAVALIIFAYSIMKDEEDQNEC